MNKKRKLILGTLAGVSALGISAAFMPTASAMEAVQPTYGTAVIDGAYGDWDLVNDQVFKMCEAGSVDHATGDCDNKDHLSNLYLRYDCSSNTMFALVLRVDGFWPEKKNDEAWIKIYQLGNSPVVDGSNDNGGSPTGNPPEFSWVVPNGTEGVDLIGYEASFQLVPDPYDIEAHINIDPGRTSSTGKKADPLEITVQCDTSPDPSIDIEKHTNGSDADVVTGPIITAGSLVTWTYWVENNGNVPLTNVAVTDDLLGAICTIGNLAVNEVQHCTATGIAVVGQYANVGSVIGNDPDGNPVNDDDPSHYLGSVVPTPVIDIEKYTNGVDADNPTGPIILAGATVTWNYVVTNIGNVDLQNIEVTDNILGTITCPLSSLDVGASMTCTTEDGTATVGQYVNNGSVTGEDSNNTEVDDNDDSHYFGVEPSLDIEKFTQGYDADDITGPYIKVGNPVFWMYKVTNNGDVDLTDVMVTDSLVASSNIDCGEGDNDNVIGILHMSETKVCKARGDAVAGQYENIGTANTTYTDDFGNQKVVNDTDPSHYFGDGVQPYCEMTAINQGPPVSIEVTVGDFESGLHSIVATKAINVTIDYPIFTDGTNDTQVITATKVNQSQSSVVEFKVTDVVGNETICDPVITIVIREDGQPVSDTFTGIPEVESNITVKNDDPGLKNIEIIVNGDHYQVAGLKDNEKRFLSVAGSMVEGENNTITLTAKGKPGTSATVVISD